MAKNSRNMRDRAIKQAQILDKKFFEEYSDFIWDRVKHPGYVAIPRILPLAMQAIDNQTKGNPAGHVYFCLWARSPDYSLITIDSPHTFAIEAGFSGERAVDTWKSRIKSLEELSFIKTFPGSFGELSYIVLYDPVTVLAYLWSLEKIQKDLYLRIHSRAMEIGALESIEKFENNKKGK